jgi:hypothetical protein
MATDATKHPYTALNPSAKADAVRKAYRAGKKLVNIAGIEMKIERKDNRVHFKDADGNQKTHIESWLVASPAMHGRFAPVLNIELNPGKNTRVSKKRA